MSVSDTLGRRVRDLRISVTDRCNFRCTYCMPKEIFNREYEFVAREALAKQRETNGVALRTYGPETNRELQALLASHGMV